MTQEQVARAVDVTVMQVSRWERGLNTPSTGSLVRLASVLGVEPGDFYLGRAA